MFFVSWPLRTEAIAQHGLGLVRLLAMQAAINPAQLELDLSQRALEIRAPRTCYDVPLQRARLTR